MSADFDKAIDRAVREMLDVEPPAGLRRRVVDQLPAPGSRLPASRFQLPAFGWAVGALATAALMVLAMFLARGTPSQPETRTVRVQPPATAPIATSPVAPTTPEPSEVKSAPSHLEPARRVVAAAAAADVMFEASPAPGFPRLPALSVPELSVSSIQRVAPVEGPGAIATEPIATPSPLAIEPLPALGRQSQE